jgi:RND family efflux transporter MFP subunit
MLFCLAFMIIGCAGKSNKPSHKTPIPVGIYKVSKNVSDQVLTYSGTIEPYKSVNFGFMVSGKIIQVFVEEGTFVKRGQIIAQLDSSDYLFAVEAAEAQYQRASKEYDRLKKLYDKNSLTQSDYDKISALYKEARADYQYKMKQLDETRLYAPDHGWISFDNIHAGEIVKQGIPIFQLVQTDKVFARFMVPENEISNIQDEKTVKVTIPSVSDREVEAVIKRIAPGAESFSRAFEVKALFENEGFVFKPGMMVHVGVPSGQKESQLGIPAMAINKSANGENYVYVIKNNIAGKRIIKTGSVAGKQVIITSGLKAGESVVTNGCSKLYEGASVSVNENNN